MVRRFAHDVLASSQRLTQAGVGSTPIWHAALLTHPPAPLKPIVKSSVKTLTYVEDSLRERFFQDFPFEAFRPAILAEREVIRPEVGPQGKDWWALEQRSKNPNSEDCIAFAANLQRHHKLPLSKAYAVATAQFAHLRAVQEVATRAAFREARAYGADADSLASGELARHNKKTENQLAKWQPSGLGAAKAGNAASSSGKRGGRTPQATGVWQLDASPSYRALEGSFSGGQAWVEGWGKWKAWAGERRQAKAEHLDRERRRAK